MRCAVFVVAPSLLLVACAPAAEGSDSDGFAIDRRTGGRSGSSSGGAGESGSAGRTNEGGAGGTSSGGAGASGGTSVSKGGASGTSGGGAGTGSGGAGTNGGGAGANGGAAGTGGATSPPVTCTSCGLGATCDAGVCVCPPGLVLEADGCKKSCAGGEGCPPFSACDGSVCRCQGGATVVGAGCWPESPGDPSTHAEADVCAVYRWGQSSTQDAHPSWTAGPSTCDGGSLPGWVRHDVSQRLSMYRWLAGVAPAIVDVSQEPRQMACAAAASWNVQYAHNIPASAKCYTPDGASGAASSNIAWGNTGVGAIDAWVDDRYDVTHSFGHRFSVLAASATSVAFGHYAGGGDYGAASCLAAGFGGGDGKPFSPFPPAGVVPVGVAGMPWTIGNVSAPPEAVPTVVEKESGLTKEVAIGTLGGSFGGAKIYLERKGWEPQAGVTYVVSITGAAVPIDYEMKVIDCP
jgi:hypothetical protein